MVLNTKPLDWEFSALTTRPLKNNVKCRRILPSQQYDCGTYQIPIDY